MEPTIYPRQLIMKVLPLLSGILFLITTILQFATGNPAAAITAIAALLFLINGVWSAGTPFATVDEKSVQLKMSLLASFELPFTDIEKIEEENEKSIILHCRNGEKKTARLHGMSADYREDFLKDITARHQRSIQVA
jgi:hypothetical protein